MNKFNLEVLKSKIPISAVADILKLRYSGQLFYCINPDHCDKTPSLLINKLENYFHCFGCGIGGDVIKLYQIFYKLDFSSACYKLAFDFNIEIKSKFYPGVTSNNSKFTEKKEDISTKKYNFLCEYDQYLFDERAGISGNDSIALECVRIERIERNKIIFQELYRYCNHYGLSDDVYSYLIDNRKLSKDVIQSAKIFSIWSCHDVNSYLKSIFDIEELKGAGLFIGDKLIFRNTHRLLIPYIEDDMIIYVRSRYFDIEGNTNIGKLKYFGLRNDDLNLNTIKRFYNTDILSGLKIYDELFICEGELDCLALLSIGLNAIAIPGVSALPLNELSCLTDYNITLCFDNDKAGELATEKLVEAFNNIGKKVNIIELPVGIKDVSDFINEKYSTKNKS